MIVLNLNGMFPVNIKKVETNKLVSKGKEILYQIVSHA
jgi:hypothetical protein